MLWYIFSLAYNYIYISIPQYSWKGSFSGYIQVYENKSLFHNNGKTSISGVIYIYIPSGNLTWLLKMAI